MFFLNLISSFDLQSVKLFHRSKGVADGKIIGFALRKQLFRHRRVNYAMFYEIFETFAFGKVTGVSRIRDMRLHDAWSFVMRKGKPITKHLNEILFTCRQRDNWFFVH